MSNCIIDASAFLAYNVSMPTITIPRHVREKDELVAISRKEYERLLRMHKYGVSSTVVKHTMRVSAKHKKFYDRLDQELTENLRDVEAGRTYGPFDTAEEAIRFLHRKR